MLCLLVGAHTIRDRDCDCNCGGQRRRARNRRDHVDSLPTCHMPCCTHTMPHTSSPQSTIPTQRAEFDRRRRMGIRIRVTVEHGIAKLTCKVIMHSAPVSHTRSFAAQHGRRWSLVDRRSSFVVRRSSLVVGRWSLVVGRWSLVVGRWSLVVRSLVVGRWSLVVGRSSFVVRRSSLVVGRLSLSFVVAVIVVVVFGCRRRRCS